MSTPLNETHPAAESASGQTVFVVVDDDEQLCRGMERILCRHFPGVRIVTFLKGAEAIDYCLGQRVDLLLTDLGLPDTHGLEVIRRLRAAGGGFPAIVVTGSPHDQLPRDLWDLGVAGFIDKISIYEHIQPAIERVLAGGMYFSAAVTPARLLGASTPHPAVSDPTRSLSVREREVARLVATGLVSKQIAAQLDLSPRTVEKYRTRVMRKLEVKSVPQLVYWCIHSGLV